ncbi:MAG: UDP-2-acetamido-2,6-dideoxy-hexulose 4-reductase [Paenibacillaceae bacterium]|jgi:GDP-4-dehydro-6-deoxy-D-mannose reductase|nr:UDP-2-acetamido-2,6-dideoxy-hexulose 4-reductase [Paenibacillaceae bacterium]
MKGLILITGAGGFTGRHACRYFSKLGYPVAAVVRREDKTAPSERVYTCDLTNKNQVAALIGQTDPHYVLHLAGRNAVADSWRDPLGCMESNLSSTLYLLEALRGKPDCRLLIAGSMLSFDLAGAPEPPHPYSLAKTMQVLAARAWGHLFHQEVLIAQPSNLIGPGHSNGICGLLAAKIVQWERGTDLSSFRLSSEHEERDYLDVRDAVAAYERILATGSPGLVYPVCSGTMRSLGDIARMYAKITSMQLPIEIGQTPRQTPPLPMDQGPMKELNWAPVISFEQSLSDALEYSRHS